MRGRPPAGRYRPAPQRHRAVEHPLRRQEGHRLEPGHPSTFPARRAPLHRRSPRLREPLQWLVPLLVPTLADGEGRRSGRSRGVHDHGTGIYYRVRSPGVLAASPVTIQEGSQQLYLEPQQSSLAEAVPRLGDNTGGYLRIDTTQELSTSMVDSLNGLCDRVEDGSGDSVVVLYLHDATDNLDRAWPGKVGIHTVNRWERALRRGERLDAVTIAVGEGHCGGPPPPGLPGPHHPTRNPGLPPHPPPAARPV